MFLVKINSTFSRDWLRLSSESFFVINDLLFPIELKLTVIDSVTRYIKNYYITDYRVISEGFLFIYFIEYLACGLKS